MELLGFRFLARPISEGNLKLSGLGLGNMGCKVKVKLLIHIPADPYLTHATRVQPSIVNDNVTDLIIERTVSKIYVRKRQMSYSSLLLHIAHQPVFYTSPFIAPLP